MSLPARLSSPIDLQVRPLRWFLERRDEVGFAGELRALLPYAAAYTVLHCMLVAAGFLLSTVPAEALAIWPPVGMLAAILTATPRRTWPVWILCSIVGRIALEIFVFDTRSLLAPLSFSIVNVVEAIIFALLLQKPALQSYNQGRPLYLSVAMLMIAAAAAVVGGLLGAAVLSTMSFAVLSFWDAARLWAAGDFVGMILIAPIAVWLMLPQIRIQRGRAGRVEFSAMVAALTMSCIAVVYFNPPQSYGYASAVTVGLLVLHVLPVLWAAFRGEFWMVSLLQLMLAVSVLLTASLGLGPFAHDAASYLPALAALQLYLVLVVLVVTTVSFVVLERQQARRASSLHQRFADMVVALTNRMIGASPATIDSAISDSLQLIGRFSRADCCVLIQVDDDKDTVAATHIWAAGGRQLHPPNTARASLRSLTAVVAQFRKRGFLILDDLAQPLRPESAALEGIRNAIPDADSALYVGLFADNELVGAIGYGYPSAGTGWNSESISLMYLVGQLFANILQRKTIEQDLELYRDKLRSMARDMAVSEERARRRTAIDLHDGIGQNLAVARMKIGQLLTRANGEQAELVQLRNLIDDALRGTRFIISDLSPSILYELGLVPALQALAERFELGNNIRCVVEESGESWQPDNDLRITVYRAVQESLNNVAKHAQAGKVIIRVTWFSEKLNVDLIDDGVGFDVSQGAALLPRTKGFGLFAMRESIVLVGGLVSVESARGIGTTVRLCVPRREREAA
ncbi:MAG: MASE1 domain-containing protein [Woeseia sp.]